MRLQLALISAVPLLALGCGTGSGKSSSDAGCTGSSCPAVDAGPGPFGCHVTFSGDFDETDFVDGGCASFISLGAALDGGGAAAGFANVTTDGGSDWVLQIQAYSQMLGANLSVLIDLGPTPSPGTYDADNIESWSAVAYDSVGCAFIAGAQAVSEGSFEANVTSVSDPTSGMGTAHGSLQIEQYVEAAAGTQCGSVPTEDVSMTF